MVTRKDIEAEAAFVQDLIRQSRESAIPTRLVHRPRDSRGYVIPYAQFIDAHGEPQFKIMDEAKVKHCLDHRLCGLCGQPMGRHIFFIGGDRCVTHGFFYDPPMHKECAGYALRTCPHIVHAIGKFGRVPEAAIVGAGRLGVGTVEATKRFALMHGHRYSYSRHGGMLLIKAVLPWSDVVWFYKGKPVEQRMHGTMLVFAPGGDVKQTHFDRAAELDEIKAAIGGGWLEKVPGFDSIRIGTDVFDCVAICDEDGKRKEMAINKKATARWHAALLATGHPGLIDAAGRVVDALVGPVVVLLGDDEFMDAL